MELKDYKTEQMKATVTKADKARYKKLALKLEITEADLVRRSLEFYAAHCEANLEWQEAAEQVGIVSAD